MPLKNIIYMKSNRKIRFKFILNLSYKRKNLFILGAITSLLLLLAFSFSAFFRPYYEHYNPDMDTNVITIRKEFKCSLADAEETSKNYYKKEIAPLFDKIENVTYSYQYTSEMKWDYLYVQDETNLHNFGFIPRDHVENKEVILIDGDIEKSEKFFHYEENTKLKSIHSSSLKSDETNTILFQPYFHSGNQALAISSQNLVNDKMEFYCCFFSIRCKKIPTSLISKITKLSSSTDLVRRIFDGMIHPACNYMRFYGIIHPILSTFIYIDVILALGIFFSTSFTQYLSLKNKQEEIRQYFLLGLSKKDFFISSNFSNSSCFVISNLAMYLLYLLFMVIFKSASGYSFFFSPLFLLLYFGLGILQILIQYLFDSLFYRQLTKK